MSCQTALLPALALTLLTSAAHAAETAKLPPPPAPPKNYFVPDQGKLLLTAGFNDADGAGGGGLAPFALITGYGTDASYGANVHYTYAPLRDFELKTYGIGVGLLDRIELTVARQDFKATDTALDGVSVSQDIFGIKVKLYGDAIYMQDSWMPQLAIGAQFKRNRGLDNAGALVSPKQLGAKDEDGTDYYLAATKVLLQQSLLLNLQLRYTKANQFGLLGFGGDRDDGYSTEIGGSIGYLVTRKIAIGAEYRGKPHNLGADDESAAWDIFAAWAPTRNVSLVAAYLNIGSVLAPVTGVTHDQTGPYLSLQAGF
ncbi:DUF3034 family protein [Steroidobacter sp.]|uniref:DUF3034 family protein n=1 Tax=Steroidobacter sp. TaxID=1978227 RepID=UPI001A598DA8|nr:DUF3034 family protein [Steroidobacter sp.]MBL8265540.1 DUF3034 family protein [Steroidobacter sp.]